MKRIDWEFIVIVALPIGSLLGAIAHHLAGV